MYKTISSFILSLLIVSGAHAGPISNDDSVLVVGATGRTGQLVVKQLQEKGIKVIAGVRSAEKGKQLLGDNTQLAILDLLEPETLVAAMQGVAAVVNTASVNARKSNEAMTEKVEHFGNANLAAAAKKAGLKKFVLVSSMGVTHDDHFLNKFANNVLIYKRRGEQTVRDSGVDYTIVRPGGLRDKPGGDKAIQFMQGDPKDLVGFIDRSDVARVSIDALFSGEASNKTFEIILGDGEPQSGFAQEFKKLKAD